MGVVKALLQEARARGLQLCVASGGQQDVVDKALSDCGLKVGGGMGCMCQCLHVCSHECHSVAHVRLNGLKVGGSMWCTQQCLHVCACVCMCSSMAAATLWRQRGEQHTPVCGMCTHVQPCVPLTGTCRLASRWAPQGSMAGVVHVPACVLAWQRSHCGLKVGGSRARRSACCACLQNVWQCAR